MQPGAGAVCLPWGSVPTGEGHLGFWGENRAGPSSFASFPGCGQAVPYGMSAALVGFLWVFPISAEEAGIVLTSGLPFGGCVALQSRVWLGAGSGRGRGDHPSARGGSIQVVDPRKMDPTCSRVLWHCRVSLLPDTVSPHCPRGWKCQILPLCSSFIGLRRLVPICYS